MRTHKFPDVLMPQNFSNILRAEQLNTFYFFSVLFPHTRHAFALFNDTKEWNNELPLFLRAENSMSSAFSRSYFMALDLFYFSCKNVYFYRLTQKIYLKFFHSWCVEIQMATFVSSSFNMFERVKLSTHKFYDMLDRRKGLCHCNAVGGNFLNFLKS